MALGMPETEAELRSAFAVAVPDAAAFLPAASRPGDEGRGSSCLNANALSPTIADLPALSALRRRAKSC
jgi:hypothetical protein